MASLEEAAAKAPRLAKDDEEAAARAQEASESRAGHRKRPANVPALDLAGARIGGHAPAPKKKYKYYGGFKEYS